MSEILAEKTDFYPLCELQYDFVDLSDDENSNNRVMMVRLAFSSYLIAIDTVQSAFERWATTTGLLAKAEALACAARELATETGVEVTDLFEMLLTEDYDKEFTTSDFDNVKIKARKFFESNRDFYDALISEDVGTELWKIIQELRKPLKVPRWLWLEMNLGLGFCCQIQTLATGLYHTIQFEMNQNADVPDPTEFRALAGESWIDTYRRYVDTYRKPDQLRARKKTRAPKRNGNTLCSYAQWFLRNKILGHSVAAIARDYCQENCTGRTHGDTDHRSEIQYGITQAKRFLSGSTVPLPK